MRLIGSNFSIIILIKFDVGCLVMSGDNMYRGFGPKVAITIFDQSSESSIAESNLMLGALRRKCNYGLPAIQYIGKDAPKECTGIGVLVGDGFDDEGNLINCEYIPVDRIDQATSKINQLEKAANNGK